MGEEKRKRDGVVSEADKALKSPRPNVAGKTLQSLGLKDEDVQAAAAALSDSSSSSSSSSSSDGAGDNGRCDHMLLDSESVDMAIYDIKFSGEVPKCHHPRCRITWKGAGENKEGMMKCIDCHYVSCARGLVREDPRGHALWHAEDSNHMIAQWYDEPNRGYCFGCKRVMRLSDNQDKFSEDEPEKVDRKVEDERATVASKTKNDRGMVDHNSKVDLEMVASSSQVDSASVARSVLDQLRMGAGNDARSHAIGNGYIIRGMPNHGNTCYMNASLQCLLALGKLRTTILSPDARLGYIGLLLKQLFVATISESNDRHMLDPLMIVEYMWSHYRERFKFGEMGDSHEFLTSLRVALDNEVEELNGMDIMQGGVVFPTFGLSIFSGELIQTVSCKSCLRNSETRHSLDGLELAVPSKDPPARIKPLQVDSCEALDFIPKLFDDFEETEEPAAASHNPEDKEKARGSYIVNDEAKPISSPWSVEDCLKLFFHDPTKSKCANCSKVAELDKANESKNVEPIMASTNVNTTFDGDQTELSDRKTSPNERSSDCNSLLVESPSRQPYRSDSHHEVILSDEITTGDITSGTSCDKKDLASCSTTSEKAESREGVQKAVRSCLRTDKQTDLLSAQDIQDTMTQKQRSGKHVLDDHSAQQVEEAQNEQTDGNGCANRTQLISNLPHVLTIQLKRYAPDLSKLSVHVSFEEILDLAPFMHPSSKDKANSSYRLVGVIVHSGNTRKEGHYIAYVRGSGSSWVCASDRDISVVSVEQVLGCEAYILFYERLEDKGMTDVLPTN